MLEMVMRLEWQFHNPVCIGIIHWNDRIQEILSRGKLVVQQTQESSHNFLISMLLKGSLYY